jgi:Mg2+ and Co2+ transporter CorA
MLRTEVPFSTRSWPLRVLATLLGEPFLGFLAIIAAALTLFPMLFPVNTATDAGIQTAQWVIIAWFGVEYAIALATAKSKRLFLTDAWRWIDLATIVVPLASLLPSVSNLLRSSPILRLIRLARLLTFGVRATGSVVRDHRLHSAVSVAAGPVHITRRGPAGTRPAEPASREALIEWLRSGSAGWFHVASPGKDDLPEIGAAAGLPEAFVESHLVGATHPHVATAPGCVALLVWSPQRNPTDGMVERRPILMLLWEQRVLSFSRTAVDVFTTADPAATEATLSAAPLPLRALAQLLNRIIGNNESIVGGFEQQLRALEDIPLRESRPAFFEQTFRLKKHLSAAQWDLWRLKAVLAQLNDPRTHVPGMAEPFAGAFTRFGANVDYLYETVVNTREDVLSVIDLHINVVSFDMNRVMRVLAVVSCLGLIPAVIGGLLGMNLIDNPWHFTLPQVSFVIGFGMLLGLYFFFVKGWLR